jgi:RNA-directed DNA polymerase
MSEDPSLSGNWQEQVRKFGKRGFENLEMLRLGFVSPEDVEREGVLHDQLDRAVTELKLAHRQLESVNRQIEDITDVEKAIAAIRARRIERVKAARAERRVQREELRNSHRLAVALRRQLQPTFLGRGVSDRMVFDGNNAAELAQRGLPNVETFVDLAKALDVEPPRLQWLAYERTASNIDHYIRFEIPKRRGGMRLISSPKPELRLAQQWVRSSILSRLPVHSAAMAFRPGVSIVDNASRHIGAELIVRLDLKDFFPSITFQRVRSFFDGIGYCGGVASVLALLCTDAPRVRVTRDGISQVVAVGPRGLPQGACTSPDLANLIAYRLDTRLQALAQASGWTYTRYADDLIFSTSSSTSAASWLIRRVTRTVELEGFEVNPSKTRVMRRPHRQSVTGLLVDGEGVRLSRRDLRRIRAFFHRCETSGLEAVSEQTGKSALAVARGYYAYVHMITPDVAERIRQRHPWISESSGV